MLRSLGAASVVTVGFAALDDRSLETVGLGLASTAIMYLFVVPLAALRDRVDGGLTLLASLPVAPLTAGAARIMATWIAALPAALQGAAAVYLVAPSLLERTLDPVTLGIVAAVLWAGAASAGALALGAITRWGLERLTFWPFALIIGALLVSDWLAGELWTSPAAAVAGRLLAPIGALHGAIVMGGLALWVGSQLLALRWLRDALEHHDPISAAADPHA